MRAMISLQNIHLQRAQKSLLEDASLVIHPGQHVGLTGANGCGKSSLFQLLQGQLQHDQGELHIPGTWRISHMAQQVGAVNDSAVDYVLAGDTTWLRLSQQIQQSENTQSENTQNELQLAQLHADYEAIDGYNTHYRAEQLLAGLGFAQAEMNNAVASFSGGWRIRLNLARALMCPADLLLLDEPTNHLDLDATFWLEQWLKQFKGTLLLISHDRDFLDQVVDHIVHFEQKKLQSYRGNYSAFERQRSERLAQQQALYQQQQQRRAEMQRFVDRFKAKATKAKQAQSRIKALERMELIAPAHIDSPFHFYFYAANKTSDPLLNFHKVDCGYDRPVLKGINLSVRPGDRIGLLGPNGAGKSTLVKTMARALSPQQGELHCGEHLKIGYFHQHQLEALDVEASALLHIQRLSPDASEQEIRNFLGGFDFHGDQALEPVKPFSGGEKARLALALIVWQRPNLLLLDEPTNHLDLDMREALTEALQGYEGAMIVVSHDRHLLRNTVDNFWLVANGTVNEFDGDLSDYQRWLFEQKKVEKSNHDKTGKTSENKTAEGLDKKARRQQAAQIRQQLRPLQQAAKKLESQIEQLQMRLAQIDNLLADTAIYQDSQKEQLQKLLQEQGQLKNQLEEYEEQWFEKQEALETLQASLQQSDA